MPLPIRPNTPPTTAGAAENTGISTGMPPAVNTQNVLLTPETQGASAQATGGLSSSAEQQSLLLAYMQDPQYRLRLHELEKSFKNWPEVSSAYHARCLLSEYTDFTPPIPTRLQAIIKSALAYFDEKFSLSSSIEIFQACSREWDVLKKEPQDVIRKIILLNIQNADNLTRTETKAFFHCFFQGGENSLTPFDRQEAWLAINALEKNYSLAPEMCYEYCVYVSQPLCGYGSAFFKKYTLTDLQKMYTSEHNDTQLECG